MSEKPHTDEVKKMKIDSPRTFDYALSNGEIELLLEHDKSGHENGDHRCCPVCRNDMMDFTSDKE
jgi:hypothetical protein